MNPRLQNDHDLMTILNIKEILMLYFWLLVIAGVWLYSHPAVQSGFKIFQQGTRILWLTWLEQEMWWLWPFNFSLSCGDHICLKIHPFAFKNGRFHENGNTSHLASFVMIIMINLSLENHYWMLKNIDGHLCWNSNHWLPFIIGDQEKQTNGSYPLANG